MWRPAEGVKAKALGTRVVELIIKQTEDAGRSPFQAYLGSI